MKPERVLLWVFLGLLAAQRLREMGRARRHLAALLARGARQASRDGYSFIVAVHALFFAATALEATALGPRLTRWSPLFAAAFLGGQALRLWCRITLGERWTTRVVVLPGVPLERRGPYRALRHPNYLAVAVELASAPLVFGAWRTALLVSLLNALVMRRRITVEERMLRAAADQGPALSGA